VAHVRVWVTPDLKTEHFAGPPRGDQVARRWEGETVCGQVGELRWIHWEVIDEGATCEACAEALGTYKPALEGDYPGPP
jgi:hypothetical protein